MIDDIIGAFVDGLFTFDAPKFITRRIKSRFLRGLVNAAWMVMMVLLVLASLFFIAIYVT